MPSLSEIGYYIVRPNELRSILQWKLWHNAVHERDPEKEPQNLQKCFYYLDMTSRSFAAVIKELNPELLVPVCVFYLILRGLDTIEDDMTIPLEEKDPLLRNFHNILEKDGWTYSGNHEREKDRELLVHFDVVITEYKKIKPQYQTIIKDITDRMGNGMADYANNAEHNVNGVDTIEDYEKYCHYVAGLVGEGCTKLFVEAGLANAMLLKRPDLHESMGQFLQQVNVIRDIREDWEDKRRFWPKEIWSKYVDKFEDLFDPANKEKALNCSSEMIANALERADDCLYYLAGLRDQSVFNFCAIPQSMAIATLELCFRNYNMFQRNIKISKGQACQLMIESTQNLQIVYDAFKRYARKIHKKNTPRDPSFLRISIACGKIEQFIETIFPSQKPGARTTGADGKALSAEQAAQQKADHEEAKRDVLYIGLAVFGTLLVVSSIMMGIAWLAGARFDLMFSQAPGGNAITPSLGSETDHVLKNYQQKEL